MARAATIVLGGAVPLFWLVGAAAILTGSAFTARFGWRTADIPAIAVAVSLGGFGAYMLSGRPDAGLVGGLTLLLGAIGALGAVSNSP